MPDASQADDSNKPRPVQFNLRMMFYIMFICAVVCAIMRSTSGLTVLIVATVYALHAVSVKVRNRATFQLYDKSIHAYELLHSEKHSEALKAIQTIPWLAQNELRAAAYSVRGDCRALLGDFHRAVADYTKALSLGYSHPEIPLANRGEVYLYLGLIEKAICDCTDAIGLDPASADAYYTRGCAHSQSGRYAEAINDFNAAILVDAEFAEATWAKGAALQAIGRQEEAAACRVRAAEIQPSLSAHPPVVRMRWPK